MEGEVKVQRVEVRVGTDKYSLTSASVRTLRTAHEDGWVKSGSSARSLLQFGLLRPTRLLDSNTYEPSGRMPGVRMDDQVMCPIDGSINSWVCGDGWYTATEFTLTPKGHTVLQVLADSGVPV
jgi:hypothetical protein